MKSKAPDKQKSPGRRRLYSLTAAAGFCTVLVLCLIFAHNSSTVQPLASETIPRVNQPEQIPEPLQADNLGTQRHSSAAFSNSKSASWQKPDSDRTESHASNHDSAMTESAPKDSGRKGLHLLDTEPRKTRLRFELPAYEIEEVKIDGRHFARISTGGAQPVTRRGYPAVPSFRSNLAVPEHVLSSLTVITAEYTDITSNPPVPSPGFVQRDADFTTAPDPAFYSGTVPFPENIAVLTETARIRHVPILSVLVYPFQYFPETGILRVYQTIEVEVENLPLQETAEPALPAAFRNPDFAALGRNLLSNYAELESGTGRGDTDTDPVTGDGGSATRESGGVEPLDNGLLIIVPDALAADVSEFVVWKRQRGLSVSVSSYPADTGSGATALAGHIQQYYDQQNIAYVIIVGDSGDVPVKTMSVHPSDTLYTLVSGDDYYHDLFISRVSASTATAVANQLTKIINYEKNPQAGGWLAKGLFVGSNEGATKSAFGLNDWELLNQERTKLTNFGYTEITTVYDPGATTTPIINAWNDGRGLVYYLGHGTETSWSTSGFSVSTVNSSLQNGAALPFVMNGNCHNGNFTRTTGDCLAEAMMKHGAAETPGGAIGVIAATTAMDWDPPIVLMRTFSELIVNNDAHTAGGFTFISIQEAMNYCYNTPDEGAGAAEKIMKQTHLFGDSTLGLRTRQPLQLQTAHPPSVANNTPFTVTVTDGSGTPQAGVTVCLYQAASGSQTAAYTDSAGQAVLVPGLLDEQETVRLTVYERNTIPYQADLTVSGGLPVIYSAAVLPVSFVTEAYSFTHQAFGGAAPYSWSLDAAAPAWLELDPGTAILSGTPPQAGTYNFTVQLLDQENNAATQAVTLTVGTPVQITTAALPGGSVGVYYSETVSATGSFTPFSFSVQSGLIPPGADLSTTGALRGILTTAGNFSFTIRAADTQGRTSTTPFTITVTPSTVINIIQDSTLPGGSRGSNYTQILTAEGGTGSGFLWEIQDGALPPGLELTPTGTLAGIPELEGSYVFTLAVIDDWEPPNTAAKEFTLTITSGVYFSEIVLPPGQTETPYSAQIMAAGSYPPFTFSDAFDDGGYNITEPANSFSQTGQNQNWTGDETEWHLELGFSFPFFDGEYTSCKVGDNGYLLFAGPSPDPKWNALTTQLSGRVLIAPFWNDMLILEDYPDTGIFISTTTDSITIRWRGRDWRNPDDILNFAVTLHADGRIHLRYGALATTNRVLVGISGGSLATREVVFTHAWDAANPTYVSGWANRNDILFAPNRTLPDWLNLAADGQLSGTPPAMGNYTFTVKAEDTSGASAINEFTITVTEQGPPVNADTNSDGMIDNTEILAFAELFSTGTVSEAEFLEAVQAWRGSGNGRSSGSNAFNRTANSVKLPPPRARLGEIFELQLQVADSATETERLLLAGYDAVPEADGRITIYAVPAELDALVQAGYAPAISGRQFVGDPADYPLSNGRGERGPPAGYRDYAQMTAQLQQWTLDYPELCSLITLGPSVQGRELWAMKITSEPAVNADKPQVRYISTMHGNEPLGTELSLELIELLLTSYGQSDDQGLRVTALLDTTEIWVVPCMNPDGYEASPPTRYNANGLDLNRAFPDGVLLNLGTVFREGWPDTAGLQPEVAAVMEWSASRSFVLAANIHTGALLVCYPYGNNPQAQYVNTPTPDDALFRELAVLYSSNNPDMWANSPYPQGIINSAVWYPVDGEMADWHYRYCGTPEVTVELSVTKAPASSTLPTHWNNNRESLLLFLEAAQRGIRGIVTDAADGTPVYAEITVAGNSQPVFSAPEIGNYHRLLLPGIYDLEFRAPGYFNHKTDSVTVTAGTAATRADVQMLRSPHSAVRSFSWPNFAPYLPLTVKIDVELDGDSQNPPAALIISENLPDGWEYVQGSSTDAAGAVLPEPRLHDGTVSWLVWGLDALDCSLQFTLQTTGDVLADTFFDGNLELFTGITPVTGTAKWQALMDKTETINLEPGWNLLSLSLNPRTPQLQELLPGFPADQIMAWEWTGRYYRQVQAFSPGKGYWLYAPAAYSMSYTGTPPSIYNLQFKTGWNLFGTLADIPGGLNGGFILGGILGWHNGGYFTAAGLVRSQGYWLNAKVPRTVNLANGEIAAE